MKVDSWCARPSSLANLSIARWKEISGQINDTCSLVNADWEKWEENSDVTNEALDKVACGEWEFDKSQFSATITSEFGLVCGEEYLKSMAQTIYFVGMICGVFTFGLVADFFGRKKTLIFLLMGISVTGCITSIMPTFQWFIFGRFLNAFVAIGIFETQFTFAVELVGGKWTTIIGIGIGYFWVVGWLSLGAMAFIFRDWRDLMLYSSLPSFMALVLIWTITESPRWLLASGRLEEAEAIVKKAAQENNRELPADWHLKPVKNENIQKTTILDLFKTRNMRTKTGILYLNWFANALSYFGLTMNIGDLGGDVYVNFTISGFLEIPAYTAAILFLLYCGRRFPYAGSLILCGVSLLCVMLVPRGVFSNDWPAMAIALFGKMCITFSWAVLFLYSAELFPTQIRASGIGSASFLGRIGGMIAPWIGGLSSYHPYVPVLVFGSIALLAGVSALWLPETQGRTLPYTIQESELLEIPSLWKVQDKKDKEGKKIQDHELLK